jgi:hypothetical protein
MRAEEFARLAHEAVGARTVAAAAALADGGG